LIPINAVIRSARHAVRTLSEVTHMKANVGGFDKGARIVVGALLIAWAATGGPVWAWIGVVPLATGLFNFCPLYRLIGVNTCRR
jgi:hypothetical protein